MSTSLQQQYSHEHKMLCAKAVDLDKNDALAKYIDDFMIPEGLIYLDGNSLGPLNKQAKLRASEVVEEQWGRSLIAGWNQHNWINLPTIVGSKIAPIIGAKPHSVVSCDSISVNLFKLLSGALLLQAKQSRPMRNIILSQADNFPTDLYMVQGLEAMLSGLTKSKSACQLVSKSSESISDYIKQNGENIAVLLLSHVNFKDGNIFNMQQITELAHEYGILVIWDIAHSAGVLPLKLDEWNVDFAVGCTYKYLNGGPGAPGFIYIAEKHIDDFEQPLSGWMGHKAPFAFEHDYEKANSVAQMLCGTPSIISMSILDAALDVFTHIDIEDVRRKSIALNGFFQTCVESFCKDEFGELNGKSKQNKLILSCNNDPQRRGSQISYSHPHAYAICQALIAKGVIADFRAPNILRLGFSPLFLKFENMLDAALVLGNILHEKTYLEAEYQIRQQVT